jgi:hypothetical protein
VSLGTSLFGHGQRESLGHLARYGTLATWRVNDTQEEVLDLMSDCVEFPVTDLATHELVTEFAKQCRDQDPTLSVLHYVPR